MFRSRFRIYLPVMIASWMLQTSTLVQAQVKQVTPEDIPQPASEPLSAVADAEAALLQGHALEARAGILPFLKQNPHHQRALTIASIASCLANVNQDFATYKSRLSPLDQLLIEAVCEKKTAMAPSVASKKTAEPQLQLTASQAQTFYSLALERIHEANYVEAIPLLHQAYKLERQPQILFQIARCYVHLGQMGRALATHQRYTKSFKAPAERLIAAASFGTLVHEAKAESANPPK